MTVLQGLTLTTALASVVTGGTLFGFSTLVMPALNRLSGTDAITAMQAINLQAPRSLLMVPLIGSLVGSMVVGGYVFARPETPHRSWLLVGVATGLVAFAITAVYHIPHNNALAMVDVHAADAAARWSRFSVPWTLESRTQHRRHRLRRRFRGRSGTARLSAVGRPNRSGDLSRSASVSVRRCGPSLPRPISLRRGRSGRRPRVSRPR